MLSTVDSALLEQPPDRAEDIRVERSVDVPEERERLTGTAEEWPQSPCQLGAKSNGSLIIEDSACCAHPTPTASV
jgi:hypothetical protein